MIYGSNAAMSWPCGVPQCGNYFRRNVPENTIGEAK
jgi:hypothetical protein